MSALCLGGRSMTSRALWARAAWACCEAGGLKSSKRIALHVVIVLKACTGHLIKVEAAGWAGFFRPFMKNVYFLIFATLQSGADPDFPSQAILPERGTHKLHSPQLPLCTDTCGWFQASSALQGDYACRRSVQGARPARALPRAFDVQSERA